MNKKRILTISLYTAAFLAAFVITLVLILPYGRIADSIASRTIRDANLPVSYSSLEAGPFGAVITGLRVKHIPVKRIEAAYTPLSALTRSVRLSVIADAFSGRINVNGTHVVVQGSINGNEAARLAGNPSGRTLTGTAFVSADVDLATTGTFSIDSERLVIEGGQPVITLEGLNVTGEYTGTGIDNISITTDGTTKIDMKGRIVLNKNAIERSAVALAGTVSLGPISQDVSISGPISRLSLRTR